MHTFVLLIVLVFLCDPFHWTDGIVNDIDSNHQTRGRFLIASAERNAEEEAICHAFLTSNLTSPHIAHLKRDLRVDEDGDFSCQLVLQDMSLPLNIRAFIHMVRCKYC